MSSATRTHAISQTPAPSTPAAAPSPGTWRHPKFDEITRRQQASTFTDRNRRKIIWNFSALLLTWPLDWYIVSSPLLNPIVTLPAPWLMRQLLSWTWSIFIPVMLLWNIWTAVSPLFRAPDNLPDIPLTPTQRSLLGLDPNATPPHTPGTTYITPPRYPRSVSDTPKSRSSSATGSPSSRSGSPLLGKTQNGTAESPYSQNTSPLWQKAVGGRETRRHRYALASPLGLGGSGMGKESVYNIPSTPSPTGGKGSIPLNSKWLFEKGRR